MTQILINQVELGERRREDLGDIGALAASIKKYGLLHPIIVDPDNLLVAGERRLRACKQLGWVWIEARQWHELSERELREIELEENLRRKDLTSYERSKAMVERVEVAREIAETSSVPNGNGTPEAGRPKQAGSIRDVAERTGIPQTTIHKAEQHVSTADSYPVFQNPDWKQYHVLEARTHLEKLGEHEREKAVTIIAEPGIPGSEGVKMLANLAVRSEPERRQIYEKAASDNPQDRSLVLTTLAEKPAMPDPRVSLLVEVISKLKRSVRATPDDGHNARLKAVIDELTAIRKEMEADYDPDARVAAD